MWLQTSNTAQWRQCMMSLSKVVWQLAQKLKIVHSHHPQHSGTRPMAKLRAVFSMEHCLDFAKYIRATTCTPLTDTLSHALSPGLLAAICKEQLDGQVLEVSLQVAMLALDLPTSNWNLGLRLVPS